MRKPLFVLLAAFFTLDGVFALASAPLEQRVVEHALSNGIRLLILERRFSPTVSIRMMFRTGSVDEVGGKTGLAHLFEHMMFKGTETLGTRDYAKEAPLLKEIDALHRQLDQEKSKGDQADQRRISNLIEKLRDVEAQEAALVSENELWNLYEREGASALNAATSHDYTQYILDLPSNKLELWALLDSDRLRHPVFRQFYQEREVVKEERRMRVDTHPEGKLFEEFLAAAYTAHPYRHPTIGWESDLNFLTVADLEDFYRRHYTPEHLTIAVVGDVKTAQVIALAERYFGAWRAPAAPLRHIPEEPPQAGAREIKVRYEAQPHLLMGFHIPGGSDPGHITCYAIAQLLANGTTSRLYKTLVEEKKLASSVGASEDYPGERYGSLLLISAVPRFPHTSQEVIQAVEKEIDRLKQRPVEDWELEKIRAAVDVTLLNVLQTNGGMASTLAYNQTIFGDWRYLLRFQKRIAELTPQDIQNAARKYLTRDNRTVALLEPLEKPPISSANPSLPAKNDEGKGP